MRIFLITLLLLTIIPVGSTRNLVSEVRKPQSAVIDVTLNSGEEQVKYSISKIEGLSTGNLISVSAIFRIDEAVEYKLILQKNTGIFQEQTTVFDVTQIDLENPTILHTMVEVGGPKLPDSEYFTLIVQLLRLKPGKVHLTGTVDITVVDISPPSTDNARLDLSFFGSQKLHPSDDIFSRWNEATWKLVLPWDGIEEKIAELSLSGTMKFAGNSSEERSIVVNVQGITRGVKEIPANGRVNVTLSEVNIGRENTIKINSKAEGEFYPETMTLILSEEPKLIPFSFSMDRPTLGMWIIGISWGTYLVNYTTRRRDE